MEPLFDALDFARQLRAHMTARPGLLQQDAAAQAGVSAATFTRALNVANTLSHESYLRLKAWMAAGAIEGEKEGRVAA